MKLLLIASIAALTVFPAMEDASAQWNTGDKTADNILGTLFGNGSNNGGILGPTNNPNSNNNRGSGNSNGRTRITAPNGVSLAIGQSTKEHTSNGYWKYWRCSNCNCNSIHKQYYRTSTGVGGGAPPPQTGSGITWYSIRKNRWNGNISGMKYRYYMNGKYYALNDKDFFSYFQQSPPAAAGNGWYPVNRSGVTTVNANGEAYQPHQRTPPPQLPPPPSPNQPRWDGTKWVYPPPQSPPVPPSQLRPPPRANQPYWDGTRWVTPSPQPPTPGPNQPYWDGARWVYQNSVSRPPATPAPTPYWDGTQWVLPQVGAAMAPQASKAMASGAADHKPKDPAQIKSAKPAIK